MYVCVWYVCAHNVNIFLRRIIHRQIRYAYGVATISRLLKITGLFCKRSLWKRLYSAKETYNFKEPINRSHPISLIHRKMFTLSTERSVHFPQKNMYIFHRYASFPHKNMHTFLRKIRTLSFLRKKRTLSTEKYEHFPHQHINTFHRNLCTLSTKTYVNFPQKNMYTCHRKICGCAM